MRDNNKNNNIDFKISLAAARVNANLTQREVAGEMHLSRHTIIKWENGKSIPEPSELLMLSSLYKIPIDYIFLNT